MAGIRIRGLSKSFGANAEVAAVSVYLPQAMACLDLQGALPELDGEIKGQLARHNRAVEVSRGPESISQLGQHLSQPGPIVKRPGQSLSLAQQRARPAILSELGQRVCQYEPEIEGQASSVAVLK